MRPGLRLFVVTLALVLLSGCERYVQRPLIGDKILASVERKRRLPDAAFLNDESLEGSDASAKIAPVSFTFSRAVALMKDNSPALKELRAEYDTMQALASVKTPLPNPAFEAGPLYGFGPKVSSLYRLQPFGSLSFSIPTGQRLKRQDELNQASAEAAYVESQAKHRELYLELRKSYTRLALGRQRSAMRRDLADSAEKSTSLTKKLIEAGLATELDAGLIELEHVKLKTEAFTAEAELSNIRGDMSQTIGVHADHFTQLPDEMLPKLPETLPSLDDLRKILLNNSPDLARIRARYELAERELHLQLAKQYPDFQIGPKFENDQGEKKTTVGLTLGLDIPLFDRNQQGIASAKQKREEIRVKFEAAANRALAALDRAYANNKLAFDKLQMLKTLVLPRAEKNSALAKKGIEAGTSDTLKYLETERNQRAVSLDVLETEMTLRSAWVELEQAIGYPLLPFPNESPSDTPPLGTPSPIVNCPICKEPVK
ncbi:MAG: TolC family protein [Planctomycetota bacterium]